MASDEDRYVLTQHFYDDLFRQKGIVIEGGPRPSEAATAKKRRKSSKPAHIATGAASQDIGSEVEEASATSGESMPRFSRSSFNAPPRNYQPIVHGGAGGAPLLISSSSGFRCKLCAQGWGLRTKSEEGLLSEEELTWNKLINDPVRNLQTFSVPTYIEMVLEGYNKIVRPKEDCGDITIEEIESHLRFCVKDSSVEKIFQIESARGKYMKYEMLEQRNIEQGIIDARAGDISLKYQQYAMKLLKEREKDLKESTGSVMI